MEGYRPGQLRWLATIACRDGERFARVYIDRGKIDEKTFAQRTNSKHRLPKAQMR
jgi:hypothetical protein